MKNKAILIIGAGRSGVAAAQMLMKLEKSVIIYDDNSNVNIGKINEVLPETGSVNFAFCDVSKLDFEKIMLCVVSPGVPLSNATMQHILCSGVPVIGEIELGYIYDKGEIIAITGTNGKTTTTSLVHEIVKLHNESTLLVGNIEIPYTGLALESVQGGATVAEISSFQLETMPHFKPKVSAILNITEDHIDRHKTFENYANIKMSIAKNQDENDFCVLNYNDPLLKEFSKTVKCKPVLFNALGKLDEGAYCEDGKMYIALEGETHFVCNVVDTNLVGTHNVENMLSAIAMTYCFGVKIETIVKGLRKFKAVEHRIEFVREKDEVKYYNDSKGTNTDAAIKAVCAMPSETVLIAGGYDKKSDYTEWVGTFEGRVKNLILIGQTAKDIANKCDELGFTAYEFAEDMQEAVGLCQKYAQKGNCVLLSPACASFGMFKSYQHRGETFKDCVNAL
ncbi:MAG: UDP-N-acetylmuramoyl-L-alanine--D-glutamate ligase [Clostridia bacterium]